MLSADDGHELFSCPFAATASTVPLSVVAGERQAVSVGFAGSVLALSFTSTLTDFYCSTGAADAGLSQVIPPVAIASTACFAGADDEIYCVEMSDAGDWLPGSGVGVSPSGGPLVSLAVAPFDGSQRIVGTTQGGVFVLNADHSSEQAFYPGPGGTADFLTVGRGGAGQPFGLFSNDIAGGAALDFDAGTLIEVYAPPDATNTFVAATGGVVLYWAYIDRLIYVPPDLSESSWTDPFFLDVDIATTLDCNRLTGRGGVMYAVNRFGSLQAELVAPSGLDPLAAWPKWQRDPANSGNAGVDLLPRYICP